VARFEMTLCGGEKLLVEHSAATMREMHTVLDQSQFLLASEIKTGSSVPAPDILVATGQITVLRPLVEGSMQGSNFRPKR